MTADIQAILQLLQRPPSLVPPAYSMVTAGSEYQRPAVRQVQSRHPCASIKTDRSFTPSSQASTYRICPQTYEHCANVTNESVDQHEKNFPLITAGCHTEFFPCRFWCVFCTEICVKSTHKPPPIHFDRNST